MFGPFSSLLTAPSATVANRYDYAFLEPAGGGPTVFAQKLHNVFFVQPAPVVKCGDSFVRVPEDAAEVAAAEDGRRTRRSTIRSRRRSPTRCRRSSRREGDVKTVYKTIYPAETTDLTPIVAKGSRRSPT